LQKNLTQPVAQRDIAARRLIELLIELRAVILQDVAALQSLEKYLNYPIIYHSIFEGEDWDKFAAEVLDACNAPDVPPQLVNMPPEVLLWAKLLPRRNFMSSYGLDSNVIAGSWLITLYVRRLRLRIVLEASIKEVSDKFSPQFGTKDLDLPRGVSSLITSDS
jgi:hypothetical protein